VHVLEKSLQILDSASAKRFFVDICYLKIVAAVARTLLQGDEKKFLQKNLSALGHELSDKFIWFYQKLCRCAALAY
jgi:hypothetical protein